MAKWKICKGWHFSLSNFWMRFIPRIGTCPVTYKFKFPKEDWFPYSDPDDLDISKLCGFSYGLHHNNSVRIGWTPDFKKEDQFILYFYLYNNGVRITREFSKINSDIDYSLTISFDAFEFVTFDMSNDAGIMPVKASEKFILPACKIGYSLWWYFGGNKTAPKKMVIWLK